MDSQPRPGGSWKSDVIVFSIALTLAAVGIVGGYYYFSEEMVIEDDHRCTITVQVSSASMTRVDTNQMQTWQATINVNKITPRDGKIRYSKVRVTIKSSEGTPMVELAEPLPDDPTGNSQNEGNVQIWFLDNNHNGRIDPGDVLRISGITTDHEGALVQIIDQTEGSGRIAADLRLPSEFSVDP